MSETPVQEARASAGALLRAARDRGAADAFHLGEQRRRTLLGQHFADQRAEPAHVVAQQGVGLGEVELVAPGSLPNDGKVIEDARSYR